LQANRDAGWHDADPSLRSGHAYLHSDHLGSASLATNASGGIEWQARYAPFGETRWISSALTTNRKPALSAANGFNGMKEESALGWIYDFNARYGVYPERSEGTPRSGDS
jgi:hypothetical protein